MKGANLRYVSTEMLRTSLLQFAIKGVELSEAGVTVLRINIFYAIGFAIKGDTYHKQV